METRQRVTRTVRAFVIAAAILGGGVQVLARAGRARSQGRGRMADGRHNHRLRDRRSAVFLPQPEPVHQRGRTHRKQWRPGRSRGVAARGQPGLYVGLLVLGVQPRWKLCR